MNQRDENENENRRSVPRRRESTMRVWADPGGVLPVIDCKVLDRSEGGARLAVVKGSALPDKFILKIDATRVVGEAQVVWRDEASVGVKLLKD